MGSPLKSDKLQMFQKTKPRILKPCGLPVLFSDPINLLQIKRKKPQPPNVTKQKTTDFRQVNANQASQLTSKRHSEKHGGKLHSSSSLKPSSKTYTAKATLLTSQPILESAKSKNMKTHNGNEIKNKHKKMRQNDSGKQQLNEKVVKSEKVKSERCRSPVPLNQDRETKNCRDRTYSRHSDPGDNVFDNIMNESGSGDAQVVVSQDQPIETHTNVKAHSKTEKYGHPVVNKLLEKTVQKSITTPRLKHEHEQSIHSNGSSDKKYISGSPMKTKTDLIDRNINFPHPVSRMKRERSPGSVKFPKKAKRIKAEVKDEPATDILNDSRRVENTSTENGHCTLSIKVESPQTPEFDDIKTTSDSPLEDDSGSDSDTSSSSVTSSSSSTTSSSSSSSDSEPSSPEHTALIQNGDHEKILQQESNEKNVENLRQTAESASNTDEDDNEEIEIGSPFIPAPSYFQALPEDLRVLDSFPFKVPKFRKYVHVETCPNGEASVLHAYQHELRELSENDRELFADDFCRLCFLETKPFTADFVMGIVHDALADQPDYLEYFTEKHGDMTVKAEVLGQRDILTMSIGDFRNKVHETYSKTSGMYR